MVPNFLDGFLVLFWSLNRIQQLGRNVAMQSEFASRRSVDRLCLIWIQHDERNGVSTKDFEILCGHHSPTKQMPSSLGRMLSIAGSKRVLISRQRHQL